MYTWTFEEGDVVDNQEQDCYERNALCHHSKTGGAYDPGLRVADVAINKQDKGKTLAKRRSECAECGKHSESQDRKETRRKVPGLVEVPACSNQRGRLCETHAEEPEPLEPIS